jgi:hypothetical protein
LSSLSSQIYCLHIFSNSISDLSDIGKKTPVAKRNTNVTDKILETLASPDVMDKIVPVLAEKIGEDGSGCEFKSLSI